MVPRIASLFRLPWLAAAFLVLLLAGCSGGGGNPGTPGGGSGGSVSPTTPLLGTWQVTLTSSGIATAPVTVEAAAVPTSDDALDANEVAQLLARTRFQSYTTGINGSTLRVTDADTDYTMVINSFSVSQFEGCDNCGVGSAISFLLTVNFSESGTFDGVLVPPRTATIELQVRYRRVT